MLRSLFGNKSTEPECSPTKNSINAAPQRVHSSTDATTGGQEHIWEKWFRLAFENLPCNAMFCDRNLILKYINKHSLTTLQRLQQYLPLPADQLVGNSIHIFHRRTDEIDDILGTKHRHDMHKLPHRAIIQLGPEKLDLNVHAIVDENGEYIGAVVVWVQVTKLLGDAQKAQDVLLDNVAEVNRQLQMISSATHEIESSIGEVAQNAIQVERTTRKFQDAGQVGLTAIEHLQESSNGVAKVAELIASIATQTSVLALNATIEAARAGIHGKGFSVVAGEVKRLAEQTASATSDIQNKVTIIRGDIEIAQQAIGHIDNEAGELSALSHQLAAAAEEQRLSTREMAHGLEAAAQRTGQIARSGDAVQV